MENKYYGFIYETTNLINGMKYIGKCIFKRQNNWKTYLGSGTYLKRAIKKYGKENFKREILFLSMDNDDLNELEEILIEICMAVESPNYYNLKKTSIGGDIFTHNPRKEEIRKMRRKQFTGEGNYWYGKKKPDHIIQAIKDGNSKKIIVDGVLYNSISDCSEILQLNISTIHYRLNSEVNDKYFYADEHGNKLPKYLREIKKDYRGTKIQLGDKIYTSKTEMMKDLKIARPTIDKMIKEGKCQVIN